jgi:hypothetical protein
VKTIEEIEEFLSFKKKLESEATPSVISLQKQSSIDKQEKINEK